MICGKRFAEKWHTFVTGVKVGLSVSLQVAGDVGCAEHLPTDATGHLAFMPDHVGTESVFGGESRGTGLRQHSKTGVSDQCRKTKSNNNNSNDGNNVEAEANDSYRYLTFKRSFWGVHMLHMAAQMVRPGLKGEIKKGKKIHSDVLPLNSNAVGLVCCWWVT